MRPILPARGLEMRDDIAFGENGKTLDELQVNGDWAFGRYHYAASDSVIIRDPETDGGGTANDSGWGLIVYHKGRDGVWRVAREAWGTDRPAR